MVRCTGRRDLTGMILKTALNVRFLLFPHWVFLCPRIERSGSYCFTFVRPSVCLSVCLSVCTTFTSKCNIFPLLLNLFSYKAYIWYEGTSHRYTSGTKVKVKVICKGQGQISGSRVSKDGCFGSISVSQTHLVCFFHRINKFSSVFTTSENVVCKLFHLETIQNFVVQLSLSQTSPGFYVSAVEVF